MKAVAGLGPPSLTRVAFGLTIVVFVLSYCFTRDPHLDWVYEHLGAEYYNVARALADGRGFSDPFAEATGPTAWMPPVFPALIALCLRVFETRSATTTAIITLTNIALIVMGVLIYAICRRTATRLSPLWGVGFYLVWILAFSFSFFRFTHDVWLIALLLSVMSLVVHGFVSSRRVSVLAWGGLAGLATLVSPAVALAWGGLGGYLCLRVTRERAERKQWLLAAALALCIATPWAIRNAVVFERFIPTKSNAGFELYLANVAYPSGIYDTRTLTTHPYNDRLLRFQYASLKETSYIAHHQKQFLAELKANPLGYLRRTWNRLVAATLLVPHYGVEHGLGGHVVRNLLYVVPLCTLLFSAWTRGPNRRLIGLLSLLWLLFLTPYILVAYYVRYLLPLTPVLATVFFLALDQLATHHAVRIQGVRARWEAWLFA